MVEGMRDAGWGVEDAALAIGYKRVGGKGFPSTITEDYRQFGKIDVARIADCIRKHFAKITA